MNKLTSIISNQDDPLPLKLKRFYQKARIIGLLALLFAFPLRVIAEDHQLADRANNSLFPSINEKKENLLASVQENALMELNNPEAVKRKKETVLSQKSVNHPELSFKRWVLVTAYSSSVDQCDSTPCTSASGTHVHDGTIAAIFLRFGAKVKFPALFGDKIFVVEDRMKSNYKVDVWFPTREEAIQFGAKRTMIEIITKN